MKNSFAKEDSLFNGLKCTKIRYTYHYRICAILFRTQFSKACKILGWPSTSICFSFHHKYKSWSIQCRARFEKKIVKLQVKPNFVLKFRYSEKPQNLKKNSHYIWHYLVRSKKLGDFSKYCGVLKISDLYVKFKWFEKKNLKLQAKQIWENLVKTEDQFCFVLH